MFPVERTPKKKRTGLLTIIEPGTLVWIPDTETGQVWVKAEVGAIDLGARSVRVKTDDGSERSANLDKLLRANVDTWQAEDGLTAVSDLSSLTHLHEPEVLQALQLRFDIDKIYTFCGPILIVLNPFKLITGLYDGPSSSKYGEVQPPPHIYSIASRAFTNLFSHLQSQVVLISGESGAGKTESTKHVLRFLTTELARHNKAAQSSDTTMKKVLSSNPLLEAFGNACTTRNDNSSRFGKFIELQFEGRGRDARFQCAAIDTYLLEKIRITELHKQERSYHIFYQACAASQRWGSGHLGLPLENFGDVSSFLYLSRSDRYELDDVDDAVLFEETQTAMDSMGIEKEEQVHIINLVAAVMHIGNIPIKEKGSTTEIPASDGSFQVVCSILGIQPAAMARALQYRLISVSANEKYDSPLTLAQSESLRESFARALYSMLFNYIVLRINQSLSGSSTSFQVSKRLFVGVLDIFGFEHFEKNSFEQLCINFANERLQQLFNQFVFKIEMDIYRQEAISCDFTDFPDNQDIIDLIQAKQSSIFTLLDEECRLPKGSDQSLVQKLWKTFDKNPRFKVEPRKPTSFSVIHFAGIVSYDTAHFMEKNMDELGELLRQAMESSQDPFIAALLDLKRQKDTSRNSAHAAVAAAGKGGPPRSKLKPNTVSADFKTQLECLMTKMASACPHFVRCIKANPEKLPDRYDRQSVTEQLRSGGVIEALCVQRAGYPCRWPHKECWENVRCIFKLQQRVQFQAMNLDQRVQAGLAQLAKELKWPAAPGACYAIGKTKVFFKQAPFEALESTRIGILNDAARVLQAAFKGHRFYRMYRQIRKTTCCVQAHVRRFLTRKRLWNNMDPQKRNQSLLFKGYRKKHSGTDSDAESEVAHLNPHSESDLRRLRAMTEVPEDLEHEREEEERLLREEEEREAEAQRRAEEERRLEEERRRQELEQRVEEAKSAAVAEERRRATEERQKAERKWQEEKAVAERTHAQEVRKLQTQLDAAREAEEARRGQHSAELQRLKRDAEVRKAECDQQMALAELRGEEAKSRIEELERENKRLREEMAKQAERHSAAVAELQVAQNSALAHAAEQHEAQRTIYVKQMDDLRESLDEAHRQQQEASRAQEREHAQRFREEVQHLRDREAAHRRRQEEELKEVRHRETERQRKWQADLAEATRSESDNRLQLQVMEQQIHDLKVDHEQHLALLLAQQEETKRMHAGQIEMLEHRHSERERTLEKELERVTAHRDEQGTTLRGQLEFQKRELVMTCQQEAEMIKQQWEQRERQLLQMLEQARLGQAEREKTAEVQLALKSQQQEELHRCADAKARHLEESARRQQELYEQHVEQLTQQMRESQESFRQQLEHAQSQNDEELAAAMTQLANMEAQMKEDQERRRFQEEGEKEETAFRLAEATRLEDRVRRLERDKEVLQQQLEHTKAKLNSKQRKSSVRKMQAVGQDHQPPQLLRRVSEPVPRSAAWNEGMRNDNQTPLRLLLGPRRLSQISTMRRGTESSPRRRGTTSGTLEQKFLEEIAPQPPVRRTITDLLGGSKARPAAPASTPRSAIRGVRLLRPTLKLGGKPIVGEVSIWREIPATAASMTGRQSEASITVLAFADARQSARHVLLAAARKNGSLSIYNVRRTALERGESDEEDGIYGGHDAELLLQFQGHAKAVTSMCFTAEGQRLVTTSSDWTVRIWRVQDGHLLNRYLDASLVVCALPVPQPVGAYVMANSSAVLRLIEENGKQQRVRLDHYARSLVLGLGGSRLLAATSRGHIHSLDVDQAGLRLVSKQQVSHEALTCLIIAPCPDGMPPLVAANAQKSGEVVIMQANATLTNFTVLRRVPNAHKVLPLRCCHVPGSQDLQGAATAPGAGFVATGSEDASVHVIDLDGFTQQHLTGHAVPVVGVAVTNDCGLLASGDVHGRVILWRRGGKAAPGSIYANGKS